MSRRGALRALKSQLRATPPKGLSALSEEQLEDLTEGVRQARRRQAAELQAAGENAFGHIPRLLRGSSRSAGRCSSGAREQGMDSPAAAPEGAAS